MKQDNALQVYYDEKLVGTLAMTADQTPLGTGNSGFLSVPGGILNAQNIP